MTHVRTLLVVVDEPSMRAFLRLSLEDEGYRVETASDGREALAKVQRHPPDAVLLDLMMPIMDGWGFLAAQRMLSAECRCPVVVMSAVGGSHMAREHGASGFLAKPFDIDELLATLATVL